MPPYLIRDVVLVSIATFVGALSAFRLQRYYAERVERRARLVSGKQAQFVVGWQRTRLEQLRSEWLEPLESVPNRWKRLPPVIVARGSPALEMNSLLFLLEGPDPSVLNRLLLAEAHFLTVLRVIDERNACYARVHERMADLFRQPELAPTEERANIEIGLPVLENLKQLTDQLYSLVDLAIRANTDAYNRLTERLSTDFPGEAQLGRALALSAIADRLESREDPSCEHEDRELEGAREDLTNEVPPD